MKNDGSLVGTRWGPIPAIGPQPRRRHEHAVSVHTPTAPWRSRRLSQTLLAGDPRRTLFRTLLRRAEGVPVQFADGRTGTVADVIFSGLGFDFWPQELIVATPEGRRRVSTRSVRRIDPRVPRIWVGPTSMHPLEHGEARRDARDGDEKRLQRLQRREDLVEKRTLPRRNRQQPRTPVGSR